MPWLPGKTLNGKNKLHSFSHKPENFRKVMSRSTNFLCQTSQTLHPYYSISSVLSTKELYESFHHNTKIFIIMPRAFATRSRHPANRIRWGFRHRTRNNKIYHGKIWRGKINVRVLHRIQKTSKIVCLGPIIFGAQLAQTCTRITL